MRGWLSLCNAQRFNQKKDKGITSPKRNFRTNWKTSATEKARIFDTPSWYFAVWWRKLWPCIEIQCSLTLTFVWWLQVGSSILLRERWILSLQRALGFISRTPPFSTVCPSPHHPRNHGRSANTHKREYMESRLSGSDLFFRSGQNQGSECKPMD